MKKRTPRGVRSSETGLRSMTYSALIAALYVILTYLSSLVGLSGGAVQCRLSEALTLLPAALPPLLAPGAVIGLFAGCLISNLLTGCLVWDVVLGSLATLLGAVGTYALRRYPQLIWIPPVLSNALIVPCVLLHVYRIPGGYLPLAASVALGELIACTALGLPLYRICKERIR